MSRHPLESSLPVDHTRKTFRELIANELEQMPQPAWQARHRMGDALGHHQFRLMPDQTNDGKTTVFSVIVELMLLHGYQLAPIYENDRGTVGVVSELLPAGHSQWDFEELVRKLHHTRSPTEAAGVIKQISAMRKDHQLYY